MTPGDLLSRLIRFDTTNPPGNEGPCLLFLKGVLDERGVTTRLLAEDPERPNLVARVAGRGEAPPLLLQGHVDVVPVTNQRWTRDPFGGEVVDGWVWGRGALDMKGGVAMMVSAVLRCLDEGQPPAGDVVLCCLADEEAGGIRGAEFLVSRHPELFDGVRHGIGEGGGATQHLGGRALYPIRVAEKRVCRLRAIVSGPGGHAARWHRGGTMARLGRMLVALDAARLPVHVTPVAEAYVRAMAAAIGEPGRSRALAVLDPDRADAALRRMGPEAGRFEAILRNTANATVVRGGDKINVIPVQAEVEIDGRMLPGVEPEGFEAELRAVIGLEPRLEPLMIGPVQPGPVLDRFYELLGDVLRELEPGAIPVPLLLTGATDQRHFGRLGINGFGFLPLRLPAGFGQETVHAADERVPTDALDFGAEALYQVLQRYRG
jgi:acetylornithine deacetylase/succinyl-diaminopimelate desuccinylase-like protein